jgi:hypothetical protein
LEVGVKEHETGDRRATGESVKIWAGPLKQEAPVSSSQLDAYLHGIHREDEICCSVDADDYRLTKGQGRKRSSWRLPSLKTIVLIYTH